MFHNDRRPSCTAHKRNIKKKLQLVVNCRKQILSDSSPSYM